MPRASRRSRASAGDEPNPGERTLSTRRRRRRRRWLRLCRLLAKKKWRGIGAMGVATILLAALLLCLTAYLKWGHRISTISPSSGSVPAPAAEDLCYFEDKDIPKAFLEYATLHNSATASPLDAKYVVYELPGNTSLAHSLLGLTSSYLYGIMSNRVLLVQWTEDFEAPWPNDDSGEAGNTTDVDRTSSLEEIFLDPGFFWSWERFKDRWINAFGYGEDALVVTHMDAMESYDSLVCKNLKTWKRDKQFIKIINAEYFAPMLSVNQHNSDKVMKDITPTDLFAYLSNWLLRPVPTVTSAVQRFRERFFEDNYVIGMEMDLVPDTINAHSMTEEQEELIYREVSDASYRANGNLTPDQKGIVVLVVTDDEAAVQAHFEELGQDSLGAAGVISITGPRGYGTTRILTELHRIWLLGYSNVAIVSRASPVGVLGTARTSLMPIVIIDTAYQSTSSQPCLADVGLVQQASCFASDMLPRLNYDPNVPCIGYPISTVADSDESRSARRRLEL